MPIKCAGAYNSYNPCFRAYNRGTVADVFDPGTYTLNTDNLPILNRLVNIPFGGKTIISAKLNPQ